MQYKKISKVLDIDSFLVNRNIKKKIACKLAHIYNKIVMLNNILEKNDEQTFTIDYFIYNIPNNTLLRVIFNHVQHDDEMNTLFKCEIDRIRNIKETQI